MPGAPSVRYPVRRSPFLARLLALGWLAGCLSLAWAWPQPSWRWGVGALVLLLAGAAVSWFWFHMPEGELTWDGGVWHGPNAHATCGDPAVRLDGQRWLLVQFSDAGRAGCWLWLEAGADRRAWTDLRRALHARVRSGLDRTGIVHE